MLTRNIHFWVFIGIAYFASWIIIAAFFQGIKRSYHNYYDRLFCNIGSILGPISVIVMCVVLLSYILYIGIWLPIKKIFKSD